MGAGFLGKLFSKTSTIYRLTDLGKNKHDNMEAEGPRLSVLVYLNDNKESSVREISENTGLSEQKIKAICDNMMAEGLIEPRVRH
jgi:DNA-binding MarR family transcriptional regulator